MANLVWGKAKQLSFADNHEYYQALGSLCRYGSYTITFETNSQTESWGDAFRIKCLEIDSRTPDAFINAMRNARRINCNDYVQNLYEQHDFDFDVAHKVLHGNFEKVKRTVPTSYYDDFENGYNLKFTRYSEKESVRHQRADLRKTGSFSRGISGNNTLLERNQNIKKDIDDNTIKKVKIETNYPQLIPVKKRDIIIHKAFGEGVVKEIKGIYITILFERVGEKKFVNPDSFNKGFLIRK